MTFDPVAYRKALGAFPTGVAVITTKDRSGNPVGLTCNSFSSVSLNPPLVLWSLRLESKLLPIFQEAKAFAINILREDQHDISANFARSEGKRLSDLDVVSDELPMVKNCVARFKCNTVSEHKEGDHIIFVGHVVSFDYLEEFQPLVFYRGAYKAISDSVSREGSSAEEINEARRNIYMLLVQRASERATSQDIVALEAAVHEIAVLQQSRRMKERVYSALKFLHLIAQAAHSPVLGTMVKVIEDISRDVVTEGSRRMSWEEMHNPVLQDIRCDIVRAIAAKDKAATERKMNEYFDHSPMLHWAEGAA